jgi:hypothetical protein
MDQNVKNSLVAALLGQPQPPKPSGGGLVELLMGKAPDKGPPMFGLGPQFAGRVSMGNLDLNNRTVYHGAPRDRPWQDYRTENSMSIGTDAGEVVIPTVVNGRQLTEDQAIEHFYRTGQHLGVFATPQDAERYAQALHLRQERVYRPK